MLSRKAKKKLVQLADSLDSRGFGEEADIVDKVISKECNGTGLIDMNKEEALNVLPGKWHLGLKDEEHRFGPFESEEAANDALNRVMTAYPEEPGGIVDQWTVQGLSNMFTDPEDEESFYSIKYMKDMFPKAFIQ